MKRKAMKHCVKCRAWIPSPQLAADEPERCTACADPSASVDDEGCEDPHCPGWLVTVDLEIERCDTCDVMSDDEAKAAAMDWLHNEWTNNRTRARMRRETRPK